MAKARMARDLPRKEIGEHSGPVAQQRGSMAPLVPAIRRPANLTTQRAIAG